MVFKVDESLKNKIIKRITKQGKPSKIKNFFINLLLFFALYCLMQTSGIRSSILYWITGIFCLIRFFIKISSRPVNVSVIYDEHLQLIDNLLYFTYCDENTANGYKNVQIFDLNTVTRLGGISNTPNSVAIEGKFYEDKIEKDYDVTQLTDIYFKEGMRIIVDYYEPSLAEELSIRVDLNQLEE